MNTIIKAFLFSSLIFTACNSFAAGPSFSSRYDEPVTDGEIIVDLLLARPLGLVGSVIGVTVHTVGLLFSVPGENFSETAEVLVERPLNYTFNRPLGRFED